MEIKELDRLVACAELRNPNRFNADRERYAIEISFRAGRDEGFILSKVTDPVLSGKAEREELNKRAKAFLDDVKKTGIREVVEWIQKNHSFIGFCHPDSFLSWIQIEPKKWQSKLREWGIE